MANLKLYQKFLQNSLPTIGATIKMVYLLTLQRGQHLSIMLFNLFLSMDLMDLILTMSILSMME